ncbi:MAG TPA: hypothetical protein VHO90_10935, partial [Bacteroidales bacterium]|nr:hypothetical protein [Bacteroidales bacterium]
MRPWLYAQNPFLNATEGNFHLARQISIYHINALNAAKTDAEILTLYNGYLPVHEDIMTRYSGWKNQLGVQQGDTDSLAKLLATLRGEKIRDWDIKIQNVYNQDTSEYMRILPDRRKPFQQGEQEDRIGAVRELLLAIGSDEALATVKTNIQAYYTSLNDTYTLQ